MTLESKKKWIVKDKITSQDEILKTLLKNREIDDIDGFLNPTLEQIPSHTKLAESLIAAEKIVKAIKDGKKIVIYGDYDVDGITGTCILWSFLYFELSEFLKIDKNNINVIPYIPDRIEEGYGLSKQSLDKLSAQGTDLIITVDCGIRDKELIANYDNIEFVITDHHIPPEDLLEDLSYTVVHQLYPGKEYPYGNVCGAFISYLLMLAIKDVVGLESSIEKNTKYLDLVAIATVTDIIPLVGISRVVVKHGLEVLKNTENVGLRKLAEVAKLDLNEVNTYHLGFVLGPRLNASGRLDLGMHALKLLCTQNEVQATALAGKLDVLNSERQGLTYQMLNEAKGMVADEKIILVMGEGWHEGVIGLVASKLQEEFYKPVIAFAKNAQEIKGSARSISGINITELIGQFSEYLLRFGGHSQAAGLSLAEENFSEFKEKLIDYVNENFEDEIFHKKLDIDLSLDITFLNIEVVQEISKLEPFGYGNKKPVFLIEGVVVVSKRVMGKDENHIKLEVKGDTPGVEEAIMFNCAEDVKKIQENDVLDLVGCLGINEWNGLTKVQFEVKEWRYCKKGF